MANGTISTWLANKIQDALLGGQNYAPPSVYLGYTLTASGINGFGSEPSGGNYGRIATNPNMWNVSTDAVVTNVVDLEYPRAAGAQGNPVAITLYDSSNAGQPLAWIPINGELSIQNRNSLIIPAGTITHRFKATSHYSMYWRLAIMNFLYLGIPLPIEPIVYAGYTTSAPTPLASGAEPVGATGYLRQAINNNKVSFTNSANGSVGTAIAIQFPESASAQGSATHLALFGSQDGAPYLCSAPLNSPVNMAANSQMIMREGSVTFLLR